MVDEIARREVQDCWFHVGVGTRNPEIQSLRTKFSRRIRASVNSQDLYVIPSMGRRWGRRGHKRIETIIFLDDNI